MRGLRTGVFFTARDALRMIAPPLSTAASAAVCK
jgi:hypothetical protein